jgi:hypothetical protein
LIAEINSNHNQPLMTETEAQSIQRATTDFFASFSESRGFLDTFEDGRDFRYKPKFDITTYELALCMYLLTLKASSMPVRDQQRVYDLLPEGAQRHFYVTRESDNG